MGIIMRTLTALPATLPGLKSQRFTASKAHWLKDSLLVFAIRRIGIHGGQLLNRCAAPPFPPDCIRGRVTAADEEPTGKRLAKAKEGGLSGQIDEHLLHNLLRQGPVSGH